MVFTFMSVKGVAGVPATLVIAGTVPADFGRADRRRPWEIMTGPHHHHVIGNGLASVVIAKWEGVFGTDTEPLPSEEEETV